MGVATCAASSSSACAKAFNRSRRFFTACTLRGGSYAGNLRKSQQRGGHRERVSKQALQVTGRCARLGQQQRNTVRSFESGLVLRAKAQRSAVQAFDRGVRAQGASRIQTQATAIQFHRARIDLGSFSFALLVCSGSLQSGAQCSAASLAVSIFVLRIVMLGSLVLIGLLPGELPE